MIQQSWRIVLALGVLVMLVGASATASLADGPKPNKGNSDTAYSMGNYVLSPEEWKASAQKDALAAQNWQKKQSGGVQVYLSTGDNQLYVGEYHEPNDRGHVNYCGPGATQVALSARLASWQIDNIDAIGAAECMNCYIAGVRAVDIRNYLNPHLNTGWYLVSGASNQQNFEYRIGLDIDNTFVLVTGLFTANFPGWSVPAYHIVAVYGYAYWGGPVTAYYAATAPFATRWLLPASGAMSAKTTFRSGKVGSPLHMVKLASKLRHGDNGASKSSLPLNNFSIMKRYKCSA